MIIIKKDAYSMNDIPKCILFITFVLPIYDLNPIFMKITYQLFFIIFPMIMIGQTSCDDANSYLVNAYSHVKDADDSNNISHLKYYAHRSLESLKLSKSNLKHCGCDKVLELNQKGIDLLENVEDVATFEDGRFFVNRARDISKETVIEMDKCAFNKSTEITLNISESENEALSELEKEQIQLNKQQNALKLKKQELNTKLAVQKQNELLLKKQQLIKSYKNVISANIKTYNNALTVCKCNHSIMNVTKLGEDISTKTMDDIKRYYTNNLKELASNYLLELNACK